MTQELILRGADIVKVGIGPGCFTPDTLVLTNEGWKTISSIKEGDLVLTHNTTWEPVTHLWKFDHHKQLVAVSLENGSEYKMTPDHKVFAIHQSKADQCKCDEDIQRLGEWLPAKDLSSEWLVATT
jgi:intein/homing endonuclease